MVNFFNKKIAVLGLGIEGEDVVRFLLAHGAKDITIFDQKNASELSAYQEFKNKVKFSLGRNYLKAGLAGFKIIFRSPAFKFLSPEIQAAKKTGAEINSSTKLFFSLCPAKIIGVTGTKGKGTTATLIYQMLKKANKEVFLAGNIGEPMLKLLPKLDKKSWVILELSSFQLQDLEQSPHLAVVLFVSSEHLDYHKDTEEYIQAKTNIIRHQKKADLAVLNADNSVSSSFNKMTPAQVFYFSRSEKTNGAYIKNKKIYFFDRLVGSVEKIKLRGEHNWDNICAAITVAKLAGADQDSIKKVIFSFAGLEHRLEPVATINNVDFYNDSFSTTPETTIAAIKAFPKPIILIVGGSEKGSDYTQLGKVIAKSMVKTLILIGQMAGRIRQASLQAGFKGKIIVQPGKMKKIVQIAFNEAKPGEIVLLSPSCASFGMFINYKDRGDQFKKNVQTLTHHP